MPANYIPSIDARVLFDPTDKNYKNSLSETLTAATEIGFLTIHSTVICRQTVDKLLETYRQFFILPDSVKSTVDMSRTGSNRGWGRSGAEQVSSNANPDYKQVFDCGSELDAADPLTKNTYYTANLWPDQPKEFRETVTDYYQTACAVAQQLLSTIAVSIGERAGTFDTAFDKPMTILRGNYYPVRPLDATDKDLGIAEHTDYGCLTLLATDGTPGLEIKTRDGTWLPVSAPPGEFIINFGEMLELWTKGKLAAAPHRVIGGNNERLSVPLFFNPRYDVNIAPAGSKKQILAGDYLSRRYDETYLHRKQIGN